MSGRALEFALSQQWAILPESMETIISICSRENDDVEAVAAKLGRPLKNTQETTIRDGVAVIPVIGPIFRYADFFTSISGATSIQTLALDFQLALESKDVNSILLEVDSPGGMVAGVAEFADMVRASSKPVVAYVSDLGASAGYWIASAAQEIVISNTAKLGSIGVVATYRKNKDTSSIEIVSTQSPKKRLDMETDAGKAEVQSMMDKLGDVFVQTVAKNRGVTAEKVLSDFGQGGLLIGQDAVNAGLADAVGSLEGVLSDLKSKKSVSKNDKGAKSVTGNENQLTADMVKSTHVDVYTQIFNEGVAEGKSQECKRIQEVEAQLISGHEELIKSFKFDSKTTGAEAAMAIIAAEKKLQESRLSTLRSEAPKPVSTSILVDELVSTAGMSLRDACEVEFRKNKKLQDEFSSAEDYFYYKKTEKGVK